MTQINADNTEKRVQETHQTFSAEGLETTHHQRTSASSAVKRDSETYAIIGAAMDVQKELGNGFLEAVYQDALEVEFNRQGIPFLREYSIPVSYKGCVLGTPYRSDFLCFESIIVELKATKALSEIEDAQVIHYLKATGLCRALLINFGSPRLEYKRLVHTLKERV
jgi:GxxExxY protein